MTNYNDEHVLQVEAEKEAKKEVNKEVKAEEPKRKKGIVIDGIKKLCLIILVAMLLIFMTINFETTRVNLLFARIEAPLVVIIFLSFFLGVVITWIASALKRD